MPLSIDSSSSRKKVWIVYGTRPEVIKMWPVVDAMRNLAPDIETIRVFTGQHRELATDLFDALEMHPQLSLNLMQDNQRIEDVGGRAMCELSALIRDSPPDLVLVQGDTTTVLFASLAAFFNKVRIGHVEAGLRSFDRYSPFPEEAMRSLTDRLADIHFAPTRRSAANLRAEGISTKGLYVTGNTSIDAARRAAEMSDARSSADIREWASRGPFVLVTLHRRESFGDDMRAIMTAIADFAHLQPSARFIFPVHPNPNLREPVRAILSGTPSVLLCNPLPYFDMMYLLRQCQVVLSDSGGLQEEAPALGKRILVARGVTERPEGVESGVALLVGADRERILRELERAFGEERVPTFDVSPDTPYGDGVAGGRIADIVAHKLLGRARVTKDWIAD